MKKNSSMASLQYQSRGLSVIATQHNKKPFIKWEKYQTERADPEQIKAWWSEFPDANVGIVTGKISNLLVIDIDSQEGHEAFEELIPENLITPLATTPGGGWHYYFQYHEGITVGTRFIKDCDFRGEGGYIIAPPSIGENGKAYSWLPNLSIDDVPVSPAPEQVVNTIKKALYRGADTFANNTNQTESDTNLQLPTSNDNKIPTGMRDDSLFSIAYHLFKGGMPHDKVKYYTMLYALNICEKGKEPISKKDAADKIESALKHAEKRAINISQEVQKWVLATQGYFKTTEIHSDRHLTTTQQKDACLVTLLRMEKKGLIKKHGNQRGCYRRVDTECESIDWQNAEDTPFSICWPFELENLALLYPKTIAVIAGTQNAGKTALALNIAYMNRERVKVQYLSSEMGRHELKGRLKKFGHPLENWLSIDFKERSTNFSDVLLPDGLNIIDYFEIAGDFWRIADELMKIYQKLNEGIAIVCLQKTEGKDAGRGGDFGLEKPRLYLNLDQEPPEGAVLSIRKAKEWAQEGKNPNLLKVKFKIVNGAKLIQQTKWESN